MTSEQTNNPGSAADASASREAESLKKTSEDPIAKKGGRKVRNRNLRLTEGYCPKWGPKDGLREIVQNFLDGICSTFSTSMDQVEFHHTIEGGEGKEDWNEIWKATSKGSGKDGKEFGSITHNRKAGSIIVTNKDVTLSESDLLTGASSKRNSPYQVGGHGEGMKVGILRLVVAGSGVKYRTGGGETWNFTMKEERGSNHETLYCETSDSKAKHLKVEITNISSEHFVLSNFLPLSRHFQSPVAISACSDGQLISSSIQDLASKRVFVKGLFVWEDIDLRVSVNLTRGRVNRDREIIMANSVYRKALANIWTETMKNEAERDGKPFTRKFLSIARHDKSSTEFQAMEYMGTDAAAHLHALILEDSPQAFPFKEGAEEEEKLISFSLQQTPYPVSERFLKLLMKVPEVITVYAAQEKAFLADSVKSPPHVYELPLAKMITAFVSKTCRGSPLQIGIEFHKASGCIIQTLLNDGTLFCCETLVNVQLENEADVVPYKVKAIAKVWQELKKGIDVSEARRINYEMMLFIASAEFRNFLRTQPEESEPRAASHASKEASEANLVEGTSPSKDNNSDPCTNIIGCKRRSEEQEHGTKRTRTTIEQRTGRNHYSTDRLDVGDEILVEEDQSGDSDPVGPMEATASDAENNMEEHGPTKDASDLNTAGEQREIETVATRTELPRSVSGIEQAPTPAPETQRRNCFSQRQTANSLPHSMQFALDDGTFEITHAMYPSTEAQFCVRHDLGTSAMNGVLLAEINLGSIFPACKTHDSDLVLSVRRRRNAVGEEDSLNKRLVP